MSNLKKNIESCLQDHELIINTIKRKNEFIQNVKNANKNLIFDPNSQMQNLAALETVIKTEDTTIEKLLDNIKLKLEGISSNLPLNSKKCFVSSNLFFCRVFKFTLLTISLFIIIFLFIKIIESKIENMNLPDNNCKWSIVNLDKGGISLSMIHKECSRDDCKKSCEGKDQMLILKKLNDINVLNSLSHALRSVLYLGLPILIILFIMFEIFETKISEIINGKGFSKVSNILFAGIFTTGFGAASLGGGYMIYDNVKHSYEINRTIIIKNSLNPADLEKIKNDVSVIKNSLQKHDELSIRKYMEDQKDTSLLSDIWSAVR